MLSGSSVNGQWSVVNGQWVERSMVDGERARAFSQEVHSGGLVVFQSDSLFRSLAEELTNRCPLAWQCGVFQEANHHDAVGRQLGPKIGEHVTARFVVV